MAFNTALSYTTSIERSVSDPECTASSWSYKLPFLSGVQKKSMWSEHGERSVPKLNNFGGVQVRHWNWGIVMGHPLWSYLKKKNEEMPEDWVLGKGGGWSTVHVIDYNKSGWLRSIHCYWSVIITPMRKFVNYNVNVLYVININVHSASVDLC
jgi:hypothetical protein